MLLILTPRHNFNRLNTSPKLWLKTGLLKGFKCKKGPDNSMSNKWINWNETRAQSKQTGIPTKSNPANNPSQWGLEPQSIEWFWAGHDSSTTEFSTWSPLFLTSTPKLQLFLAGITLWKYAFCYNKVIMCSLISSQAGLIQQFMFTKVWNTSVW